VAVRRAPVGAERVGLPLAEPHLCPHRPILLKRQACHHNHHPPPPSSCYFPWGGGGLAVTKPFRICVRAESMCSLGDGKRRRKEPEGGEEEGGGLKGAAVVGTVTR